MDEKQFEEMVRLLFGMGTAGRAILEELELRHRRTFDANPYVMARKVGAWELLVGLREMADGR